MYPCADLKKNVFFKFQDVDSKEREWSVCRCFVVPFSVKRKFLGDGLGVEEITLGFDKVSDIILLLPWSFIEDEVFCFICEIMYFD